MQHPGITLQIHINESGMSRKELALRTGVTEKHISTILNGRRSISVAFAKKLGYVFETPRFWIDLQSEYDEYQANIQEKNAITQEEVSILKHLRKIIESYIEKGYLNSGGDIETVLSLRSILNVSNLLVIPEINNHTVYRIQQTSNVNVDPYVMFAWQRLCELEAAKIDIVGSLNVKLLVDNLLSIKSMMFDEINTVIIDLQKTFASCGIAFQVVKNFRGAPVQGYIKKLLDGNLILCLTIRGQRADTFWFTLFHEIAHIVHGDYDNQFIDFSSARSDAETEADKFSCNMLIDPEAYRDFLYSEDNIDWESIKKFAAKNSVQPFIVLGRLQKDGILDWSDYSSKVVKYVWS